MISSNFVSYVIKKPSKIELTLSDGSVIILNEIQSYNIDDSNSDAYVHIENSLYSDRLYNAMKTHRYITHLHIENKILRSDDDCYETTSHIASDCNMRIRNCILGYNVGDGQMMSIELEGELFN